MRFHTSVRSFPLAILATLAACGGGDATDDGTDDVSDPGFDASPTQPDAGVDAALSPDAVVRGSAQMQLLSGESGVPVVFVQPDGTIASDTVTDELGIASADLLDGGAVLVVRATGATQREVTVHLGVDADARLAVGDPTPETGELYTSITVPPITVAGVGTANSFTIQVSCGIYHNAQTTTSAILGDRCGPSASAVVSARYRPSPGAPATYLGTLYDANVELDGTSVVIDGTYVDRVPNTMTFENLPSWVDDAELRSVGSPPLFEGFGIGHDETGAPSAGTFSSSGDVTAFGMHVVTTLAARATARPDSFSTLFHRDAYGASITHSGGGLLPLIETVTFDVAARELAWTTTSGGSTRNVLDAHITTTNAAGITTTWLIVSGQPGNSLVVPALPASYDADFDSTSTAGLPLLTTYRYADDKRDLVLANRSHLTDRDMELRFGFPEVGESSAMAGYNPNL